MKTSWILVALAITCGVVTAKDDLPVKINSEAVSATNTVGHLIYRCRLAYNGEGWMAFAVWDIEGSTNHDSKVSYFVFRDAESIVEILDKFQRWTTQASATTPDNFTKEIGRDQDFDSYLFGWDRDSKLAALTAPNGAVFEAVHCELLRGLLKQRKEMIERFAIRLKKATSEQAAFH